MLNFFFPPTMGVRAYVGAICLEYTPTVGVTPGVNSAWGGPVSSFVGMWLPPAPSQALPPALPPSQYEAAAQ